jgi:tape measure domain-containing protein
MVGITSTVVGVAVSRGILKAADDFQILQQRLAQVTESQQQVNVLFRALSGSAQSLRLPVEDVTELFVKLRQSNSSLGLTFGQTKKVTEAVSAALRISGATGQAASSSLLQFGQAMAKGRLDGDEFRTVAENASEVLRVLERRFNVSRGEILKWREEGKLTAEMVANALIGEVDNLNARVAKLPPTLSQAATSFRNNVLMMIADSSDLQTAMGNIAQGIIDIGNWLRDNGPLVKGTVEWTAKIWLAVTALRTLKTTAEALGGVAIIRAMLGLGTVGAGSVGGIFAMGAAGAGIGFIARDLREAADESKRLKNIADATKKPWDELVKEFNAAKVEMDRLVGLQKQLQEGALNIADLESKHGIKDAVELNRKVIAQRRIVDVTGQALGRQGSEAQTMAGGGGVVAPPLADATKDTTDKRISALLTLLDLNIDVARVTKALNAEMERQQKIADNDSRSFEDRAEAASRVVAIQKGLTDQMSRGMDVQRKQAIEDIKTIGSLSKIAVLNDEQKQRLTELKTAEEERLRTMELTNEEQLESRDLINDINEAFEEQRKKVNILIVAIRALAGANAEAIKPKEPKDRLGDRLDRQLSDMLRLAPGEMVRAYFETIGLAIDEGGQSIAEKMREALGNAFSNIGNNVIQQGMRKIGQWFDDKAILAGLGKMIANMGLHTTVLGKFLVSIYKTIAKNPLLSGFALLAIGGAMVAYGNKLGGAASGKAGGFDGYGNGLGIGGAPATQPYVFQNRPYQNPMQGMGSTPDARGNVTVNATIIGPNDPQAQRQIADLVNNASRRGLVTGSAMRTR